MPTSILGRLIRDARTTRGWSQSELADKVGKSRQWVLQVEKGDVRPDFEALLRSHRAMAQATGSEIGPAPLPSLMAWILAWVGDQSSALEPGDVRSDLDSALAAATAEEARRTRTASATFPRSLMDFPFTPISVVCGDRREDPAMNFGDVLFARTLSITDLTFLPELGLPKSTRIYSDKLFVRMPLSFLEKVFGQTHLLVIGSPAVNLLARELNDSAVFRWVVDPGLDEWFRRLLKRKPVLDNRKSAELFSRLLRSVQEGGELTQAVESLAKMEGFRATDLETVEPLAREILGDRKPADWLAGFREGGILDPADSKVHGSYVRHNNDFGLVSLALNPYDSTDRFLSVLVAGRSGPGTAHALRTLAVPQQFKDHPLGGVIEVLLDEGENWSDKLQFADTRWQTAPYKASRVVTNVLAAKSSDRSHTAFRHLPETQVDVYETIVHMLASRAEDLSTT